MAQRKSRTGSKLRRLREHTYMLAAVYGVRCYVTGELIDPEQLLAGDASDGVCWHHIDFDRTNNDPSNLALCTRSAHRAFHNAYERGEDIRTPEAVEHWGPTPVNQAPNRNRVSGTILPKRKK